MSNFKPYNNNEQKKPSVSTYSAISFTNDGQKYNTRLGVSYLNKVLRLSFSNKLDNNTNAYDNDNAKDAYISYSKAKILYEMIEFYKNNDHVNNVEIEIKDGILVIDNGRLFGCGECIGVIYNDKNGNEAKIAYEFKKDFYYGVYNYTDRDNYEKHNIESMELDTLQMVLLEYWKASSYAIANSVNEAALYRNNTIYGLVHGMAQKLGVAGVKTNGNSGSSNFLGQGSSSTSFNRGNSNNEYNSIPSNSTFEQAALGDISSIMG